MSKPTSVSSAKLQKMKLCLGNSSSFILLTAILFIESGCLEFDSRPKGRKVEMVVTGYCPCKKCCGWERNWFGRPVYAQGKSKGRAKKVGFCADGTKAKLGTIAADTKFYPFGTKMFVPGYGGGTVHDRGGKIKGPNRIDIYFSNHQQALQWGRQKKVIIVEDQKI